MTIAPHQPIDFSRRPQILSSPWFKNVELNSDCQKILKNIIADAARRSRSDANISHIPTNAEMLTLFNSAVRGAIQKTLTTSTSLNTQAIPQDQNNKLRCVYWLTYVKYYEQQAELIRKTSLRIATSGSTAQVIALARALDVGCSQDHEHSITCYAKWEHQAHGADCKKCETLQDLGIDATIWKNLCGIDTNVDPTHQHRDYCWRTLHANEIVKLKGARHKITKITEEPAPNPDFPETERLTIATEKLSKKYKIVYDSASILYRDGTKEKVYNNLKEFEDTYWDSFVKDVNKAAQPDEFQPIDNNPALYEIWVTTMLQPGEPQ